MYRIKKDLLDTELRELLWNKEIKELKQIGHEASLGLRASRI